MLNDKKYLENIKRYVNIILMLNLILGSRQLYQKEHIHLFNSLTK